MQLRTFQLKIEMENMKKKGGADSRAPLAREPSPPPPLLCAARHRARPADRGGTPLRRGRPAVLRPGPYGRDGQAAPGAHGGAPAHAQDGPATARRRHQAGAAAASGGAEPFRLRRRKAAAARGGASYGEAERP